LVVSGINSGLNAGINVLYSGTVAAAIEGAFFGVTSIAVSVEFEEHAQFDKAARLARGIIEQILARKGAGPQLYNMNIPTAALTGAPKVCSVPMNVTRYGDSFEKRKDPWGRDYFWLTGGPPACVAAHETDLSALAKGMVTLTPLDYDLSRKSVLAEMETWQFSLSEAETSDPAQAAGENQHATKPSGTRPCDDGDDALGRLRRRRVEEA
jgi:5'-nucleotidase